MISFLIVNYYSSQYVLKLVLSIRQFIKTFGYEVMIYDNSNNEEEYQSLLSIEGNEVHVFRAEKNIGFVAANNILYQKASGEFIILINPDTLLIDDSLVALIKYIEFNDIVAIAGPQLLNEDFSYQISFFKFPNLFSLVKEYIFLLTKSHTYQSSYLESRFCDVVKGACLVINKRVWEEEKIFDDRFVMYSEEVDLCKRVQLIGLKTLYFAEAKIIHYGEKSSTLNFANEYSIYNYYKSKLIYFNKFNKVKYSIVKSILLISLVEKSIAMFFVTRFKKSIIYIRIFKRILNESKNINSQ